MIDTHCHLHDERYDADRDDVVERARTSHVRMITVGCDMQDSERALAIARKYEIPASIGIHPHEAKDAPQDIAAAFAPMLDGTPAIAIGETGLDYYYDHSPRDVQALVLRAQMQIARERNLPLIFHQRDAYDDFIAILREEWKPGMRGVVHCFTGTTEQAQTFVDEFGLYLGIGGVVTFANANGLRDAVRAVGIDAIVLETDAPYLTPVPLRGQRNEPSFMVNVAAKLSELLDMPEAEVTTITDRNAFKLFGV
jgi:TatD DNase family protein